MILHIGVHDIPEPMSSLTTYELGKILERKYGLFSKFYELNEQFIDDEIAKHLLDTKLQEEFGAPKADNIFLDAVAKKFQLMLETQQFDGLLPGVPTQAALDGFHRQSPIKGRKRGKGVKAKKASRPSFIDTATLKNDIVIWVD